MRGRLVLFGDPVIFTVLTAAWENILAVVQTVWEIVNAVCAVMSPVLQTAKKYSYWLMMSLLTDVLMKIMFVAWQSLMKTVLRPCGSAERTASFVQQTVQIRRNVTARVFKRFVRMTPCGKGICAVKTAFVAIMKPIDVSSGKIGAVASVMRRELLLRIVFGDFV